MIAFTVHGEPIPQGSKTRTRWGGIREDNPRTKPWRATVAADAALAMNRRPLLAGAVALEAVFTFPRPKAHYGTGRNAGTVKASAPTHHTKTPDLDKLLRALGDALTGIVVRDDSQLSRVTATKVYGKPARVEVRVAEVGDEAALLRVGGDR